MEFCAISSVTVSCNVIKQQNLCMSSPTYLLLPIFALYHEFPVLLTTYQNIIQNLFSMLFETYLIKKIPWNFLQNSMGLFEQHLNDTCGSMEFHGILSRSKVPWNSMELFPCSRVPWNSMEFHEISNFPEKKFHRIPWNLINLILKKSYF